MSNAARRMKRQRTKQEAKVNGVKITGKAISVQFSNGEKALIHEPLFKQLPAFIKALPALQKLGEALKAVNPDENDEALVPGALPPEITDELVKDLLPLMRAMSSPVKSDSADEFSPLEFETLDDFGELPVWDGMVILNTLAKFIPKNLLPPAKESTS